MRNCAVFVFILIILLIPADRAANSQELFEQSLKFGRVLEWIDRYYVDSVQQEKLVETAIIGMLKDLDPHSQYLTKKEAIETDEPLQGNFEGIGISFSILYDTIFVISPISGGPSERVGIMAGDRIVKVEGENVAGIGITNNDVYKLLRGEKNTKVTISILRRGVKELLDFTIIRDKIPIFSIDASYMVKDDIGYIKINRFSLTTIDEFRDAIEKLEKQNINSLILDLTGNGGGYLDVAIKISDQFLGENKLIVYTEGINNPRRDYMTTSKGVFENGNIVILIDEGSASASEIVAGAIQDWDRGIIVGRRSFGKGLVQRPLRLPDSSIVRLTVARYYTPTGRLIQKPYDMSKKDYDNDIINRYNNGELVHKDSIHFPDSLKYNTLKYGRVVYGGGGIMPDFFVPIDTSFYSDYYRDLLRKGVLNRYTLNYTDKNRDYLESKYPEFNNFKNNFVISDKLFNEFTDFAKEEDLEADKSEIELSGERIKLLLKAYIARDLWGTGEFYRIVNDKDTKYQKAIQIMDNWDYYWNLLMKK
jgi:carboxyl-terminal processing protease